MIGVTKTDSPKASDVENTNNAEYARGEEAGRTGNIIADMVHDTIGQGVASDQYNEGYKAGVDHRK
ncbi:hypothetical protein H6789_00420 [Candidatus Nomurabacteria bacterium]|nr:hypothetical protein [Candidatus Nomurabacteria bacterium]